MSDQRDIVERLRQRPSVLSKIRPMFDEAADEIASLRAQLASATIELADAKSNVAHLSNAAETAFRDRDYYSAQLASARKALHAAREQGEDRQCFTHQLLIEIDAALTDEQGTS